jgi:beta-lactamase superfamily II metal-dependent hydrolase
MANDKIRVRSYNVGFGDCFLVTIPDGGEKSHLLIDFGNAPGKSGSNEWFPAIAENIERETDGHINVLVMTHEHLDHMEGFYSQRKLFDRMTVDQVWMGLPSHPDYYDDYPNAKPHKKLRLAAEAFERSLKARQGVTLAPSFATLLRNNLSNIDRIDYVRQLGKVPPKYLRRGSRLRGKPASRNVKFRFLAPEKDMSSYYHGGHQRMHTLALTLASTSTNEDKNVWSFQEMPRISGNVPPNLSRRDWKRLRETIQLGAVEAVRSIDKAANNTSLVFLLEVGEKRLLFPGDAELKSWEIMCKKCAKHFRPVDFLKVSHHGSHNGTSLEALDDLLPVSRKDKAVVMVSTKSKVYGTKNPVPDSSLLKELRRRCRRMISTDTTQKRWVDAKI